MNRILKSALVRVCIAFTAAMALWCALGLVFAGPVEGIVITLSLLAACLLLVALQVLWFTETVLVRPSYPARIAGYGLTALPALAAGSRRTTPAPGSPSSPSTWSRSPPSPPATPSTTVVPSATSTRPSPATAPNASSEGRPAPSLSAETGSARRGRGWSARAWRE